MTVDPTLIFLLFALLLALIGTYRLVQTWRHSEVEEIVSQDEITLRSARLGLSGRPDCLIRLRNGAMIPKEAKPSSERLYDSHRIQVGAYLLLIEEEYGVRPPYGIVALKDGSEVKIQNTRKLRRWTLDIAKKVRALRANATRQAHVQPTPGQCLECSYHDKCTRRVA